ncbi:MAG: cobaltochelatase CobS [Alphaproteobacteria bacterium]|jgi:cobaltochelatase CobS
MQGMKKFKVSELFGFDSDMEVMGFAEKSEFVPEIDASYHFDPETTMVVLAGFENNLKILLQGYHGTGKSTHIEQVAARLNWPCFRLNLDGHISRLDLIGKDAIVLEEGQQVTSFKEGVLPWAMSRPMVLVLDEYDAGRPEVMFVIQRLMEQDGGLTLPDQNRVVHPHAGFRLFGTSNTVGLGDHSGLYQGTYHLNQAQLDRWNMVAHLNYLDEEWECQVVRSKVPTLNNTSHVIEKMVRLAGLTRVGFMAGDLSAVMSPRTVIMWAQNSEIVGDVYRAFLLTFVNRCDTHDKETLDEYYVRVFGAIAKV